MRQGQEEIKTFFFSSSGKTNEPKRGGLKNYGGGNMFIGKTSKSYEDGLKKPREGERELHERKHLGSRGCHS